MKKGLCDYCGLKYHRYGKCPAVGKSCMKCSKVGHFASVCRSTGPGYPSERQRSSQQQSISELSHSFEHGCCCQNDRSNSPDRGGPTHFLHAIDLNDAKPSWRTYLMVNKQYTCFKIDTGADVCVMSVGTYQRLRPKPNLKNVKC